MNVGLAVCIKDLEVTSFVSKTADSTERPSLNCRPVRTPYTPYSPESLMVILKLLVSTFLTSFSK